MHDIRGFPVRFCELDSPILGATRSYLRDTETRGKDFDFNSVLDGYDFRVCLKPFY